MSKIKMFTKVFGLLAAFAIVLGIAAPASAFTVQKLTDIKDEGDFVVGPGKVELYMAPGESVMKEVMVTNRTGRKLTFQLSVEDIQGSFDTETPVALLGNEKGPYTLKDFIKPEKGEFELNSGERALVNVSVALPADTEPGGRYGALVVSTKPESPKSSTANIVSRLAVLYYVRVKGDVLEKASFSEFKTSKNIFSSGPVPFEMTVRNDGNVHLTPSGKIEVTSMTGKKVGVMKVDPWFILPNSMKMRQMNWDTSAMLFGKYKAIASINLGYGDDITTKETTFWIIPWKTIVTLFVLVVIVILILEWFKKNFVVTKKTKKSKK